MSRHCSTDAGNCHMEALEQRALLSTSPFDPAFGNNGILTGDSVGSPSPGDSGGEEMALQRNGKLLLASKVTVSASNIDCQIAQYKRNGVLDHTFATQGKLTLNFDQLDTPADVAVQADGKILVLIDSSSLDFSSISARLVRLLSTGTFDNTFGKHGIRHLNPSDDYAHIGFSGVGKIILDDRSGKTFQLNNNGRPDVNFGLSGVLTFPEPVTPTPPAGSTTTTNSRDRKSPQYRPIDGKFIGLSQLDFIATDTAQQVVSDVHTLTIDQYTATGQPDKKFGVAGVATIDMKAASGEAVDSVSIADFALQSSGKILIAGHISTSASTGVGPDFILRLKIKGTLDTTFGAGGFFWFDHPITRIVPTSDDGAAFTARIPQPQSANDILVGRLDTQGRLLPTYGSAGSVTIDFGAHDYPESLIIQPDGKFLLLATRSTITDDFEYLSTPAVARLGVNGYSPLVVPPMRIKILMEMLW
jgi:uncharacterized delta-60 repeat protein